MRLLLEQFVKTDEQKTLLQQYSENDVETLTLSYLAPLYATGTLRLAQQKIVSELGITDSAVADKIYRYLLCFCETILLSAAPA